MQPGTAEFELEIRPAGTNVAVGVSDDIVRSGRLHLGSSAPELGIEYGSSGCWTCWTWCLDSVYTILALFRSQAQSCSSSTVPLALLRKARSKSELPDDSLQHVPASASCSAVRMQEGGEAGFMALASR